MTSKNWSQTRRMRTSHVHLHLNLWQSRTMRLRLPYPSAPMARKGTGSQMPKDPSKPSLANASQRTPSQTPLADLELSLPPSAMLPRPTCSFGQENAWDVGGSRSLIGSTQLQTRPPGTQSHLSLPSVPSALPSMTFHQDGRRPLTFLRPSQASLTVTQDQMAKIRPLRKKTEGNAVCLPSAPMARIGG